MKVYLVIESCGYTESTLISVRGFPSIEDWIPIEDAYNMLRRHDKARRFMEKNWDDSAYVSMQADDDY